MSVLLARAASDEGAVVLISGEAGIGKTHLCCEICARAKTAGFDALVGRCFVDAARSSFAAWREALGPAAVDGPPRRLPLAAQDERTRTFERVLGAVLARAEAQPTVIAIEDLQWADADTLHLFLHVARFGLRRGLLVIGTIRTPDLDAAANPALEEVLAELGRDARCHRFELGPLSIEEASQLATSIARASLPQSLAGALFAESAGNPLYLRELVRYLLDTGKLSLHDGRLASDVATGELGLPPTVRDLVRGRVSRLAAGAAGLVRAAAALAVPGDLSTLAQGAEIAAGSTLEALDQALASGLLRAEDSRYELAHAVVRRAIYEGLNPDRRMRLHRRLAEALQATATVDHAAVASQYLASRGLPGFEAGVAHALAAAEAARTSGAHERAATFFAIACDLAKPLGDEAVTDVLSRLAISRAEALDPSRALAAASEATRLMEGRKETGRIGDLLATLAAALEASGTPRAVYGPLVGKGLAAVGARRDLVWARLTLLAREPVAVLSGPVYVSRFDGFDPDAVHVLRSQGSERDFAATVESHAPRPVEESEALIAKARTFTDVAASIRIRDACVRDRFFRGNDFRKTAAEMEELRSLSASAGSLPGQGTAEVVLACCWATLGEFDRARDSIARVRDISRRLGSMHRMNRIGPLAAETVLGFFVGASWPEIARPLVEFISSPQSGSASFGIVALSLGLVCLAMAGDGREAGRLFPLHLRALEAIPPEINEWGAGRDCGATAVWLLGATEYADRYLSLIRRQVEGAGVACWSSAVQSEGCMLALLGDTEGASRRFDLARSQFVETGRWPSRAICDYDEALALCRAGHGSDGRVGALLDQAQFAFRGMGMAPWIERAEALRGGPASAPAPANPDGLTEREIEVLRLLAAGMSNKEIGARLFISVATVERHIANIYGKIDLPAGTRGRVAASAYARRMGLAPG